MAPGTKKLAKRVDVVYGCPTIPQDDGDDDNPNETYNFYFLIDQKIHENPGFVIFLIGSWIS